MKYTPGNSKAAFVIKNNDTGQYLHKCTGSLIGKGGIFSNIAYDWAVGTVGRDRKRGAATFTREDTVKILKHLRSQGADCCRKPVGKRKI